MYLLKNAWRNVCRSRVRSILIGVIICALALFSCIGLSIRQAAETSREASLELTSVTGTISVDRSAIMRGAGQGASEGLEPPSKDEMSAAFSEVEELGLEELESYADADVVEGFYWTGTISVDGDDALDPVESTFDDGMGRGGPQSADGGQGFSEFSIVGYSSDDAMTAFIDGTSEITEGSMFEESASSGTCVISEELAAYNSLAVGDTITVVGSDGTSSVSLEIVGVYAQDNAASGMPGGTMMGGMTDSANAILVSYGTLEDAAATLALEPRIEGTYEFQTAEDFESFEQECRDRGLSEEYTVSSPDIEAYEQSLVPLENLGTYATWFVCISCVIGAIVLVVLNMFSIRERRHEIGILCAIGMKKHLVAAEFLIEMLIIAGIALVLGTGVGAAASVPVTNALLSAQIESSMTTQGRMEEGFGRELGPSMGEAPEKPDADMDGTDAKPDDAPDEMPSSNTRGGMGYITRVDEAINPIVLIQLTAIAFGLVLAGSAAGLMAILRFDPIEILTNRG